MKVEHTAVRPLRVGSIVVVAAVLCGCRAGDIVHALDKSVKGSGKKASEIRTLDPFHGVELSGSGNVEYRIGSPQSVKIEVDDNLLERVETVVKNGKLRIGFKGSVSPRNELRVSITAPACDQALVSGSGNIRVYGLKEQQFDAAVTGSGNVEAQGSSGAVAVLVSGSGTIDLTKVRSRDAKTAVTGSGSILVAPSGVLDAVITGSGNIAYSGAPTSVRRQITGSGSIERR